jgi:hypothetical protein
MSSQGMQSSPLFLEIRKKAPIAARKAMAIKANSVIVHLLPVAG